MDAIEVEPLPTPWPTPLGGVDGGRASPYPGPLAGEVTASWTPPAAARLAAGPVLTSDGRVALALDDRVVFLDPGTLLPVGQVEGERLTRGVWLTAGPDELVVLATTQRAMLVTRHPRAQPIDLLVHLGMQAPSRVLPVNERTWATASDEHVALVHRNGMKSFAQAKLSAAMSPVVRHAALSPTGMMYVANAMSWLSSEGDEPPEYHGHLIGLSAADMAVRFSLDQNADNLPSATGLELQIAAYHHGVLIAEHGVAAYDERGQLMFELRDTTATPPFAVVGRELVIAVGRPRALIGCMLPRAVNDTVPPPRLIKMLEPDEAITALVGAADGDQWYVGTTRRLLGLGRDGRVLFEVPGLLAEQLACGNGCLFAVERPLKLSRIG